MENSLHFPPSIGTIPWTIPEDMKHFRKVTTKYGMSPEEQKTMKNVVIMGRKTWESLPDQVRPLKDRINIVLTSKPSIIKGVNAPNLHAIDSLDNALQFLDADYANSAKNTFLIGGARVYEEGLYHKNCRELFLTRLGLNYECDTFVNKEIFKNFKHMETSATRAHKGIPFDF